MPKLRKYQVKAARFALEKTASYMALDMGLGKTAIALAWIQKLVKTEKAALVIAPIRTIHTTWPDEVQKWTPKLKVSTVHGTPAERRRALRVKADIYLINPENTQWLVRELRSMWQKKERIPFNILVLDEGSLWKASKTKRFKALKRALVLYSKYRLILSGTPAPNSLLDLWSQYYILDDGERLGTTFTGYQRKHFHKLDEDGYYWGLNEGSQDKIYKAIADITYRLDAEDHLDLPELIYNHIEVELTPALRKTYRKLETEFFIEFDDAEIEAFNSAALSMKLRQFIQGALYDEKKDTHPVHTLKLDALQELYDTLNGSPILCMIQFKFEHRMIREKFGNVPLIAGGTPPAQATQHIRDWNEGKIPLLLSHPASIGHGTNLQFGGHLVLWYGIPWSLEQYLQTNKRLHRSGQESDVVTIHHLVMKNTIDRAILRGLGRKDGNQTHLLNYLKAYRRSLKD